MKKRYKYTMYLILMLISAYFSTMNVYADDILSFDFKTDIQEVYRSSFYYDYLPHKYFDDDEYSDYEDIDFSNASISNMKSYKDGYLEVNVSTENNKYGTEIIYYDYSGKKVKSKFLENYYLTSPYGYNNPLDYAIINGEDIYCLAYNLTRTNTRTTGFDSPLYLLKINANFEVENKVNYALPLTIRDNKLYALHRDKISEFDLDLNNEKEYDKEGKGSVNSEKAYLSYVLAVYDSLSPSKLNWLVDKVFDDYNVDGFVDVPNILLRNIYNKKILDINNNYVIFTDRNYESINIYDKDGNEIYKTKIDRNEVQYVKLIHNFLALVKNDVNNTSRIEFYDFNGNLQQTLKKQNDEELFVDIVETNFGVSVYSIKEEFATKSSKYSYYPSGDYDEDFDNINMDFMGSYYNEIYTVAQPITLNIIGSGNIRVLSNAKFGQMVTFEVDTPEGQMLKSIRVYDSYNNSLEVENNTFVMPRTPVRIDAEFVPVLKENPETGLATFAGLAILAICLTIYISKNKSRLTTLKKI